MNILKLVKKTGFSIVEVIIATVIFSIVAAGLFATISSLNQPAQESQEAVTAVLIAKQILEELYTEVNATTWDETANKLTVSGPTDLAPIVIGGKTYTPTKTVTADPDTSGRYVTLTVSW